MNNVVPGLRISRFCPSVWTTLFRRPQAGLRIERTGETLSAPPSHCLSLVPASCWAVLADGCSCRRDSEFDHAKWKLDTNAWVSAPSGYFNGEGGNGYFDLQRDFGFGNYATFSGKLDWRFKRKHHLLFGATPIVTSQTTTLTRTITWQGRAFDLGAQVLPMSSLSSSRPAITMISSGFARDLRDSSLDSISLIRGPS